MDEMTTGVCAPKGFMASGLHAGIRKNHLKKDLSLIMAQVPCAAAAVYTRNKVFGAPVAVTRAHLQHGTARAMLCNSGNANTCNADGIHKANAMCELLAKQTGIEADDVIIASTGVIGQPLPLEPIAEAMPALVASLSAEGGVAAAEAIMTTDTLVKQAAEAFTLDGAMCTIGGMAKGSGMIAPNMATMLCFLTTDAAIAAPMLDKALRRVTDDTFNMLIIDGDTSTNDMAAIMASGLAGNAPIETEGEAFETFVAALHTVCESLTRMMARDGEGATKLVTCRVDGAPDVGTARAIARSVILSPLCKAAMFGADANWGRILCAIGYTQGEFAVDLVKVIIRSSAGQVLVCEHGAGVPFLEAEAKKVLLEDEITLHISMGQGVGSATSWGCDLTYDYVKINGDYRT
ncbi:MAG: bifunctional glutamate N-acetyltransferase/amino-acid acetyltransferase ArgJ [Firmicutes bacterium]|nr:bifunctional glutamate N-acetyltransferase/amino-acid acetyltransferase ArgJ [Bacillota bacterium]